MLFLTPLLSIAFFFWIENLQYRAQNGFFTSTKYFIIFYILPFLQLFENPIHLIMNSALSKKEKRPPRGGRFSR